MHSLKACLHFQSRARISSKWLFAAGANPRKMSLTPRNVLDHSQSSGPQHCGWSRNIFNTTRIWGGTLGQSCQSVFNAEEFEGERPTSSPPPFPKRISASALRYLSAQKSPHQVFITPLKRTQPPPARQSHLFDRGRERGRGGRRMRARPV